MTDPQQEPPVARCSRCGGELYQGEAVYIVPWNGQQVICEECLASFARDYFRSDLVTLQPIPPTGWPRCRRPPNPLHLRRESDKMKEENLHEKRG